MVRRLLCLLLIELPEDKTSDNNIQKACVEAGLDTKVFPATVTAMNDAGSRYRNLEKVLGPGVIFVLGNELPESQYVVKSTDLANVC
jgi:hypothetical protein